MSMTTQLDTLITTPPPRFWHYTIRVLVAMLSALIIWAAIAPLEEVSVANGEVVPQEQVQTIQHLEGGIVEKIHVREGMHVTQGQELMQLNLTSFTATKEELEVQLQGLKLQRLRLQAMADGKESFTLDEESQDFRLKLKLSEEATFNSMKQELESRLSLTREQMQQRELDVQQLRTERSSIKKNLAVLREKLRISTDLIRDQLTSRLDHLQLKSEVEELSGRLQILDVAIPKSLAALKEANEKLHSEKKYFENKAQEELRTVEIDIARTQENLNRADDQVLRTTITSPIAGIVKSLENNTLGGVVRAGEVIMEIVPQSDNLVVEARLHPKDIGFVEIDQDALVKMETYDFTRFGGLEGKVIAISADSYIDQATQEAYFEVVIRTDKNYLGATAAQWPITPGMQATIDIKTGSKTVLQYLLKPVLEVTNEAFRER